MTAPLHVKYRPKSFADVLGQAATVASLRRVLADPGMPHAFLFTGPSGTGKTTLARIVARELGINEHGLIEIDAATRGGVDQLRRVSEHLGRGGFFSGERRLVILDECQELSKGAWSSLLKPLEEPPASAFWVLCTTELAKVPEPIRQRCAHYETRPVPVADIEALLQRVVKAEKLKVAEGVLPMLVHKASGSPRRALVGLEKCEGLPLEQAREVMGVAVHELSGHAEKILAFLKENGEATRTDLTVQCFGRRLKADQMDEALAELLDTVPPSIVQKTVPRVGKSGSPTTIYKLA